MSLFCARCRQPLNYKEPPGLVGDTAVSICQICQADAFEEGRVAGEAHISAQWGESLKQRSCFGFVAPCELCTNRSHSTLCAQANSRLSGTGYVVACPPEKMAEFERLKPVERGIDFGKGGV